MTIFATNAKAVPLESARVNVFTADGNNGLGISDGAQHVTLDSVSGAGCYKRNDAFLQCTLSKDGIATFLVSSAEPHSSDMDFTKIVISGADAWVRVHVDEALRPGTTLDINVATKRVPAEAVTFGPGMPTFLNCLRSLSPPACDARVRPVLLHARLAWMGSAARFTSRTLSAELELSGSGSGVAGVDAWIVDPASATRGDPCGAGAPVVRGSGPGGGVVDSTSGDGSAGNERAAVVTLPLTSGDPAGIPFFLCATAAGGSYNISATLVDSASIKPLNVSVVPSSTQAIDVAAQPALILYGVEADKLTPTNYSVGLTVRDCKGQVMPLTGGLLAHDPSESSELVVGKPQIGQDNTASISVSAPDTKFHHFVVELPGLDSCFATVGSPSFDGGMP